jgi:hypothetical protein
MHCGDVVNLVEVMAGIGIVSDNRYKEFVGSPGIDFLNDCIARL